MTNTKKNAYKELRSWNELLTEKKAYLKRKQEEEDAKWYLREFNRLAEDEDDDPTEPL